MVAEVVDAMGKLDSDGRQAVLESREVAALRAAIKRKHESRGVRPRARWSEGQRQLRDLLLRQGMKAASIARRVGCSASLVSRLASGDRHAPARFAIREGFRRVSILPSSWDQVANFTAVTAERGIDNDVAETLGTQTKGEQMNKTSVDREVAEFKRTHYDTEPRYRDPIDAGDYQRQVAERASEQSQNVADHAQRITEEGRRRIEEARAQRDELDRRAAEMRRERTGAR
jgi:transcriptional regulator with XRE-family HTH domain